jgi:hypothetical protein
MYLYISSGAISVFVSKNSTSISFCLDHQLTSKAQSLQDFIKSQSIDLHQVDAIIISEFHTTSK